MDFHGNWNLQILRFVIHISSWLVPGSSQERVAKAQLGSMQLVKGPSIGQTSWLPKISLH